jgi:hypothetical protein
VFEGFSYSLSTHFMNKEDEVVVKDLASRLLSELPSSEYSVFLRLGVQSR